MNKRIKELAKEAGYYLYDLTETHECKTVETDSTDEWITLEKFAELIRADEREACAKLCDDAVKINLDAKSEFAKIKSDCINAKLAAQIKAFKASIESAIEVSEKTAIAIRARGEVK